MAKAPLSAVAREENISREWASREAHHPETQLLVANLLDRHTAEVDQLVSKGLQCVAEALQAEDVSHVPIKTTTSVRLAVPATETTPAVDAARIRELELVKVSKPDHYARLTAVKRLIELATAGRAVPKPVDAAEAQLATLDQLQQIYEQTQRTQ